jgi:general L-amino acid transport system substrate-binding protein
VAAVILSAANKVRFINTMATNRFTGPQSGEVDMLVRNTTWTLGERRRWGSSSRASISKTAPASW